MHPTTTIAENSIINTLAHVPGNSTTYNGKLSVGAGATWRPLDNSLIVNDTVTLGASATVDLAYKYDPAYAHASHIAAQYQTTVASPAAYKGQKDSYVLQYENWGSSNYWNYKKYKPYRQAVFYGGLTLQGDANFILNVGNESRGYYDSIFCQSLTVPTDGANLNFKINYRDGLRGLNWSQETGSTYTSEGNDDISIFTVVNAVTNSDKLTYSVENGTIDSALNKYLITAKLEDVPGYSTGIYKRLVWTATKSIYLSQGLYNAANSQLAMRNLARTDSLNVFQRAGELHQLWRYRRMNGSLPERDTAVYRDNLGDPVTHCQAGGTAAAEEPIEGPWFNVWRGSQTYSGVSGSSFDQSYTGATIGYDKEREGKLYGGDLYTGFFLSNVNANADVRQNTFDADSTSMYYSGSRNELKSQGFGVYSTWLGGHGQYLDLALFANRLTNDFSYTNADNDLLKNSYATWNYGAAVNFGRPYDLGSGWFIEPQAGLTLSQIKAYQFLQNDTTRYTQRDTTMLLGRAGFTFGKKLPASSVTPGVVYLRANVVHDFRDGGTALAEALNSASLTSSTNVIDTRTLDNLAGHDTWYDLAIGANLQTSPDSDAYIELTKSTGGKVNTKWQINAGMNWAFGPGVSPHAGKDSKPEKAAPGKGDSRLAARQPAAAAKDTGKAAPAAAAAGNADTPALRSTAAAGTAASKLTPLAAEADAGTTAANSLQAATTTNLDSYELEDQVVEAARPDWESKLSPGTVSVVKADDYRQEMKNLPDLLQTVPGVFIDRTSGGTGHYTVARVRGSTGSEVNVYIDGVLVNSGSEAAVDLSIIPIENVERIEVYRGYVPARFAGSPLGGAINIVTKKPQETHGYFQTGIRSFGGVTANLSLTAKAGDGSLLFAMNRDQAKGNFNFTRNWSLGSIMVDSRDVDINGQQRTRLNNAYHNTDMLLKWQDAHWFAKLTWKDNYTERPYSLGCVSDEDWLVNGGVLGHSPASSKYHIGRWVDTKKTEFQFGRRQTVGKLEWGWQLGTYYQNKEAATVFNLNTTGAGSAGFGGGTVQYRSHSYNAQIDGSWHPGKNHLVEFMLNGTRERMNIHTTASEAWEANTNQGYSKAVAAHIQNAYKNDYNLYNYFIQVQDTMTLNRSGNLFFTPLFRLQKASLDIDKALDPDEGNWLSSYNLALKKKIDPHITLKASYGTYYRVPSWFELFGDGATIVSRWTEFHSTTQTGESLQNFIEKGTSWDVGVNWKGKLLKADTDLTLTYFHRDADHLANYCIDPMTGAPYYDNAESGKIHGLELGATMQWGKRWSLSLSGTWNDSQMTETDVLNPAANRSNAHAGRPFIWLPKYEYNVRLNYLFPGDKLSMFTEYHWIDKLWGAYGANGTGSYNAALGIADIGFKYTFDKDYTVSLGVNDIFNKGPQQLGHMISTGQTDTYNVCNPQQGRTWYMTVQRSF